MGGRGGVGHQPKIPLIFPQNCMQIALVGKGREMIPGPTQKILLKEIEATSSLNCCWVVLFCFILLRSGVCTYLHVAGADIRFTLGGWRAKFSPKISPKCMKL